MIERIGANCFKARKRAIFGDKARDMRDTSLRVSSGESGKGIGVRVFSRDRAKYPQKHWA